MKENIRNIGLIILIGIFALNSLSSPCIQTFRKDFKRLNNSSNEKETNSLLFQLLFVAIEEGFVERNDNEETIDFLDKNSLLNTGISNLLRLHYFQINGYATYKSGSQFLHLFLLYCCFKIALPK